LSRYQKEKYKQRGIGGGGGGAAPDTCTTWAVGAFSFRHSIHQLLRNILNPMMIQVLMNEQSQTDDAAACMLFDVVMS
jgi:hypothetical protein